MSKTIKIEFFHDVICSFCFPMSARMRKLAGKYSNLEIVHRSFALGWTGDAFIQQFGSRQAVKAEVLNHWVHANENDDDHRFNISGMAETNFDFPISRPGLIAAKAAGIMGDQALYWDAFDAIQKGLFVQNLNIEDPEVLENIMGELPLDLAKWREIFMTEATEGAVLEDLALAQNYGIHSAPSLLINGKYLISGAQPMSVLENALEEVAQREDIPLISSLVSLGDNDNNACRIVDGQWQCE